MSKSRLKMRQIREILRYRFENGVSFNKISDALKISKGSVVNTVKRFEESKLSWPLSDELSDSDLELQLYPPEKSKSFNEHYPTISYLEQEMKRPHVTLQLLYEEYAKDNPNGLKRTAFYDYYNKSFPNRPVTM
ncbi:MAG: IS21 family transposase, partial [Candidatus Scalindua sp.]|nr:IS21 family transposase [Candidatus Scalindua sp.]